MTMLDLRIEHGDGAATAVSVPDDLPSGHVAAHTATSIGFVGVDGAPWVFVRAATGETLDPAETLSAFGLAADESVRLAQLAAAAEQPTAVQPTVPQPLATTAAAPAPGAPPPAAGPAPAATTTASAPKSSHGALIAVIASIVLVVLIVVGIVLGTSGGGDEKPTPFVPPAQPVDSSDSGSDDDAAGTKAATAAPSKSTAAAPTTGLAATSLTPSHGGSYVLSLPASWTTQQLDELEGTSGATTRRRTKLVAPTGGTTLVIDDLIDFAPTASSNRTTLDASYRTSQPGYRRVAFATRALPRATAYEWQYVKQDASGRPVRAVDEMFDLGDHLFAVLVTAHPDVPFTDISMLARRVARSIELP